MSIVRIYLGITQIRTKIRKMNDFKNYKEYFDNIKNGFEDLVTKALFL